MDSNTSQAVHVFPAVALRMKELRTLIATHATSHLQDKIETEVIALQAAVYEFKVLRNSCVALLRMPPEVLSQITDHLVAIWPAQYTKRKKYQLDRLGWIALSHVSRRLRDVLLDRKDLWAQCICTLPRARSCMLLRAGESPVSLRLNHMYADVDDLQFVLHCLPRARAVEINGRLRLSEDTWTLEPAEFSQKSLPFLEELDLTLEASEEQLDLLTSEVWELPPSSTPRLRILHLRCMAIPFNPVTLTVLSVSFDSALPHLYSPLQLLEILRQCKALRELKLVHAVPLFPFDAGKGHHPPVDLPLLNRLFLQNSINPCLGLWSCITVPPSCTTIMHLHDVQASYPDFRSHLRVVPSRLGPFAAEVTITGISVWDEKNARHDVLDGAVISWLVSDTGKENPTWTGPFECDFKEHMSIYMHSIEIREPHFLDLLDRALEPVDATRIEVLELGTRNAYDPGRWMTALTPFLSLRTLYLDNMPETPLLLALIPTSQTGQEAPTVPILPSLRFLWLGKLAFYDSDDDGDASSGPKREQFVRMLLARRQRNCTIEHLRIGELHMEKTQAERSFLPRIRAIVPLVECNAIFPNTSD